MKSISLYVCFILCALVSNGYSFEIFKANTLFLERYDNTSIPTDVAFTSPRDFAVYDAMGGRIINYKGFKRTDMIENSEYDGGNCLVLIENNYYLCDSPDKRVLILDKKMNVTANITGGDKFDPTDLASYKNTIYIVDNDNHRIAVYNSKTKKIESFLGKRGGELNEFSYPFSVAIDKDGFLFISEVINTRIQLISDKLKGVMAIGRWGVNAGELYRPKGVAVIGDAFLIVSDGYIGVLQVFNARNGKFIGVIGDKNGEIKRFSSPTRIRAFGNSLAIADPYDRLVEIIDLGELK